jgi:hypothetical protein
MTPTCACWARDFNTAYGCGLRQWLVPAALDQAYWNLPPVHQSGGGLQEIPCAHPFPAFDAARGATSTVNSRHAFSAARLVPFNASKPLASRYVRDGEEDVERPGEARQPGRIHTNSRVLTLAEFLARLAMGECPSMRGRGCGPPGGEGQGVEKLAAETERVGPDHSSAGLGLDANVLPLGRVRQRPGLGQRSRQSPESGRPRRHDSCRLRRSCRIGR